MTAMIGPINNAKNYWTAKQSLTSSEETDQINQLKITEKQRLIPRIYPENVSNSHHGLNSKLKSLNLFLIRLAVSIALSSITNTPIAQRTNKIPIKVPSTATPKLYTHRNSSKYAMNWYTSANSHRIKWMKTMAKKAAKYTWLLIYIYWHFCLLSADSCLYLLYG